MYNLFVTTINAFTATFNQLNASFVTKQYFFNASVSVSTKIWIILEWFLKDHVTWHWRLE